MLSELQWAAADLSKSSGFSRGDLTFGEMHLFISELVEEKLPRPTKYVAMAMSQLA